MPEPPRQEQRLYTKYTNSPEGILPTGLSVIILPYGIP